MESTTRPWYRETGHECNQGDTPYGVVANIQDGWSGGLRLPEMGGDK